MHTLFKVLTVAFCALSFTAVHAQDNDTADEATTTSERVLLILDSSGSMWGQIDGTAKYEIARDVVGELATEWSETDALGLMAYGHRREGDCTDIELISPTAPGNTDQLVDGVNGLRPLGKTPLTDALRAGAEALSYTEAPGTIVLLTDGFETCSGDPCAMARELATAGVSLQAHVIGFDLGGEDTSSLQCIADETGGTFILAEDAGGLGAAMNQVMETALLTRNVTLRAVDGEGEALTENVIWNVFEADSGARAFIGIAPVVEIALAPEAYRLTADRGDAGVAQEFTVPEGEPIVVDVLFAAGTVELTAHLADGSPAYEDRLSWTMSSPAGDEVAREAGSQVSFTLTAGTYQGRVSGEDIDVDFAVTILPEETHPQSVVMNAGTLNVAGMGPSGAPTERHVSWSVFEVGDDAARRPVAREVRRSTSFLLAAGDYRVVGSYQDEAVEIEVTLEAGQAIEHSASFAAD